MSLLNPKIIPDIQINIGIKDNKIIGVDFESPNPVTIEEMKEYLKQAIKYISNE